MFAPNLDIHLLYGQVVDNRGNCLHRYRAFHCLWSKNSVPGQVAGRHHGGEREFQILFPSHDLYRYQYIVVAGDVFV